ncbi:hypothetical protein SBOR_5125 [Sclerotinia borealis F-4128]|uniref:CFEM domain-containing protein n=1 Tax=Sclerotinia borealis (strain F-4128) TaxID=1432307 RepID=W9CCJ6_SCLBF|nr:hypothetical protein SBOR_5125 [Sclerotinia borealis F-4128]
MKFSIIALAAAATTVSAAEFPGQPACASPCISQAITQGSPCNIEDVGCQCDASNRAGISTAIIPCILSACTGAGELQQASEAGPSRCSLFSAGALATSATSSSASESSTESSSASPASTTSSGPASTTGTEASTTAPATTSRAGNGTITTGTPSSTAAQVTQNAAQSVGFAGVGAMVGLLAGVVAAL